MDILRSKFTCCATEINYSFKMVRDDILGGLQLALERGESLEQAMISFLNAGYPQKDIEEAAGALQNQIGQMQMQQPAQTPQYSQQQMQPSQPAQTTQPAQQMQQSLQPQQVQQPVQQFQPGVPQQKVSNYGNQKSSVIRIVLIAILAFVLVLLLGALVGIFVFRDSIIDLFTKLLS